MNPAGRLLTGGVQRKSRTLLAGKLILAVSGLVLVLAMGVTGLSSAVYSAEYTFRVMRHLGADVNDYKIFPGHPLAPSSQPFVFARQPDEDRVRRQFEAIFSIGDFDAFLRETRTQAFIVIQDDTVLYDGYLNGASQESIVTSFSVAKSFTSALVGIAIAEGAIASVDDPITRYLPEMAARDPRFSDITIRHLLMMSSGIRYVERNFLHGDDARTYYHPDLRRLALERTHIVGSPGERFLYNNYHPLLLGMILERATGQPVTNYLQAKIWDPIGTEFGGSWSQDSEASGFEKMESGINGRAIDFAKFGKLFLHQGWWEEREVVPAEWVAESTQAHTLQGPRAVGYYPDSPFFTEQEGYYQYFWWGREREGGMSDFWAMGNQGQFIYVSPQANLVIVRHGERYGVPWQTWADGFYRFASGGGA